MHEERPEVGRDFSGVFEHQEPSPRLTGAWWRCSRRGSQDRDHAEPVGQGLELGFILSAVESFQEVSSKRVT